MHKQYQAMKKELNIPFSPSDRDEIKKHMEKIADCKESKRLNQLRDTFETHTQVDSDVTWSLLCRKICFSTSGETIMISKAITDSAGQWWTMLLW